MIWQSSAHTQNHHQAQRFWEANKPLEIHDRPESILRNKNRSKKSGQMFSDYAVD
jgi:hypothetical protein